ncbi:MAG: UDP-3-O-(3-hydroxymyristoyl)glucosamine N-acyltransferase [Pseudomonadota bacterium]
MVDLRFFEKRAALSLERALALATEFDADCVLAGAGPDQIDKVAAAGDSDLKGALVFCDNRKAVSAAAGRSIGLCLTTPALAEALGGVVGAILKTRYPRALFARLAAQLFAPRADDAPGEPEIASGARVHDSVAIGAGAVIGEGAIIGAGAVIRPGVVIGAGCEIGPGATIGFAILDEGVQVLSGARIGEAGFGFAEGPRGIERMPQLGRVIIGAGAEIGANTTIDRGALGDTEIGAGAKIDNLVQIGHNVKIGAGCILAAQVGVSGSCVIGDGAILGGQVGVADHVSIGAHARVAAQSGIMRDIPAGESWGGYPAQPSRAWLRSVAAASAVDKKRRSRE